MKPFQIGKFKTKKWIGADAWKLKWKMEAEKYEPLSQFADGAQPIIKPGYTRGEEPFISSYVL